MARIRERALARLALLRSHGLAVLQSALASGLAWYFAHDLIGHPRAFFAPIAALIALGAAAANHTRVVVELALGVAVGIGVGDLLIRGIGTGAWQVALVVLLAMTAAILLGGGHLFISQAASSGVLVATLVGSHNASRFVDALVGGAVGLAVLVAVPGNPLRRAREASIPVFEELAATLETVATALETRDVALTREALARVRAIEPALSRWRAALELGHETVRISPPYWRARTTIDRHVAAAQHIELAVRNARVLARAASRAVELHPSLPPQLAAALRELAIGVREVGAELGRGGRSSAAVDAILHAAGLATLALEPEPSLSVAHVVGQIRSLATDLLRALGVERSAAIERVRGAAERLDR